MKEGQRRLAAVAVLLWAGWAYAHAQAGAAPPLAEHPSAAIAATGAAEERARIHQERQAIDRALQQAETACYQHFAVEDCLQKERRSARQGYARLRQREAALEAAERRERAAQRLEAIAEQEKKHPPAGPAATAVPGTQPGVPVQAEHPVQAPAHQQQKKDRAYQYRERQTQAQSRAQQQQDKRAAHQASQAEALAAHAAGAAKARQLQEEKKAAAARHKARVLQLQADNAAAGRKPAAPLSPDP